MRPTRAQKEAEERRQELDPERMDKVDHAEGIARTVRNLIEEMAREIMATRGSGGPLFLVDDAERDLVNAMLSAAGIDDWMADPEPEEVAGG